MKLYFSKARNRFECSEIRNGRHVLLDHDTNATELAIRQGFMSHDEEMQTFTLIENEGGNYLELTAKS